MSARKDRRRNEPAPRQGAPSSGAPAGVTASRVALLIAFAMIALLAFRQVGSLDAGFHLKAGEHILENGWPSTDPFTYTVNDRPYVDTSWGYQVLLITVHRLAGAPGIVLLNVLLGLGIFGTLWLTARLAKTDPVTLPLAILLGGLSSEMRLETRPELVSYLLLAVVLYLLHRHAEGKASPLWLLVPIHLVWVNTHGLFVTGWVAEACFLLGLHFRDWRVDRRLLLWAGAGLAVSFLNPYGWRGVVFPLELATRLSEENVFAQSIGEFTSPFDLRLSEQFPFYPRATIHAFRGLVCLSGIALILAAIRKRFWSLILWAAFMALAYRMIRNIPLFVIATLPATAWGLPVSEWLERMGLRGQWRAVAVRSSLAVLILFTVVTGLRVANDSYYIFNRRTDRFGAGWNRISLPVDAAGYAAHARLGGPGINHLNFGGWLMWALPEPVFIDGRLEVMGEEFYERYRRTLRSPEALEAAVRRHGIRWIVFPYAIAPELLGRLSRDGRWDLLYADHLAAIFGRKGAWPPDAEPEPLLPARAPRAPDLRTLPGLGGPERPGALRRWIGPPGSRARFPVEDYYLGLFHLFRGELEPARDRLARAIAGSGGAYYEIYNNLGAVLFRMERYDQARACYQVVLREEPGNRIARERLRSMPPGGR